MIKNTDCIEGMKAMEANSVDSIVTDPPYGIGFMNKEWDNFKLDIIKRKTNKAKSDYLGEDTHGFHRTKSGFSGESNQAGLYDQSISGHLRFQQWFTEIAKEMLRVLKLG